MEPSMYLHFVNTLSQLFHKNSGGPKKNCNPPISDLGNDMYSGDALLPILQMISPIHFHTSQRKVSNDTQHLPSLQVHCGHWTCHERTWNGIFNGFRTLFNENFGTNVTKRLDLYMTFLDERSICKDRDVNQITKVLDLAMASVVLSPRREEITEALTGRNYQEFIENLLAKLEGIVPKRFFEQDNEDTFLEQFTTNVHQIFQKLQITTPVGERAYTFDNIKSHDTKLSISSSYKVEYYKKMKDALHGHYKSVKEENMNLKKLIEGMLSSLEVLEEECTYLKQENRNISLMLSKLYDNLYGIGNHQSLDVDSPGSAYESNETTSTKEHPKSSDISRENKVSKEKVRILTNLLEQKEREVQILTSKLQNQSELSERVKMLEIKANSYRKMKEMKRVAEREVDDFIERNIRLEKENDRLRLEIGTQSRQIQKTRTYERRIVELERVVNSIRCDLGNQNELMTLWAEKEKYAKKQLHQEKEEILRFKSFLERMQCASNEQELKEIKQKYLEHGGNDLLSMCFLLVYHIAMNCISQGNRQEKSLADREEEYLARIDALQRKLEEAQREGREQRRAGLSEEISSWHRKCKEQMQMLASHMSQLDDTITTPPFKL